MPSSADNLSNFTCFASFNGCGCGLDRLFLIANREQITTVDDYVDSTKNGDWLAASHDGDLFIDVSSFIASS